MFTTIDHSLSYDETAYHPPISFALTGIAVHGKKSALAAFALSTADNVDVQSGSLGSIQNSAATCDFDFTITWKKCYRAHDDLFLTLPLVREIRNILR
jgi:hypothetical protein